MSNSNEPTYYIVVSSASPQGDKPTRNEAYFHYKPRSIAAINAPAIIAYVLLGKLLVSSSERERRGYGQAAQEQLLLVTLDANNI